MPNIARGDRICLSTEILFPGIDPRQGDVQRVWASARPGGARPFRRGPERCAMNRVSLVVATAILATGSAAAAVIAEQSKPSPTYETRLQRRGGDDHTKS